MNHELIERYIYAVTRLLPPKTRAEVEKELRGLISDMLDERCGDILPAEKDVRVVLTELGKPEELAAKYSGEEQKSLISGVYYLAYRRVLKIVLPIVAAVLPLAVLLAILLDMPDSPYWPFRLIGQMIGGTAAGVFQAFAVITLIFAVLERAKADLRDGDFFSNLPPVPRQADRIKPYEPIFGILWSIAAAVLFLAFPQIIGVWRDGGEVWLPILNVDVIRGCWILILLWAVLGIIKESVKLLEGRPTKRLAAVTLLANALTIAGTAVVFLNHNVLNPEFLQHLSGMDFGEPTTLVQAIGTQFGAVFFGVVCFALLIETVTAAVKALPK